MSFIFLYFISPKISPSSVPEDLKPKSRKRKGEQDPTAESSRNVKKKNPLPHREFCLLMYKLYLSNKLSQYSVLEKSITPMSPPQPQVRARELGRVKDFPGGNLATSASRIAFLQSLCKLPKYLHLVNLVEPSVGAFFTRVIGCIHLIFF